jgi:hypothetical protein
MATPLALRDLRAGDTVMMSLHGMAAVLHRVQTVGSRYITVNKVRFDFEGRHAPVSGHSYPHQIELPAVWQARQAGAAARRLLRDAGITIDLTCRLDPTAVLEVLRPLLDAREAGPT